MSYKLHHHNYLHLTILKQVFRNFHSLKVIGCYTKNICLCLLESEASEFEEDSTEVWNEEVEDEILNDLELSDPVPPTDSQLDSASVQYFVKMAFAFPHVYSSNLQALKYCCFSALELLSCVSFCPWPV